MPSIRVKELRGYESVWALNAYYLLVFGLGSEQAVLGQDYDTTAANFEALPEHKKETQLRHALQIVNLSAADMQNLLFFALDANGIPYAQKKPEQLGPEELVEAMLAVCLAISRITPRTCPTDAKKN